MCLLTSGCFYFNLQSIADRPNFSVILDMGVWIPRLFVIGIFSVWMAQMKIVVIELNSPLCSILLYI